MSGTRLNKYIASSGLCSRRKADELIESGVVMVNGKKITELGFSVQQKDKVFVNGKLIHPVKHLYYRFYKPAGYITTSEDEKGRKTIYDLINELTHPSVRVPKLYRVVVNAKITQNDIDAMAKGIEFEDGKKAYAQVEVLEADNTSTTMEILLFQGLNRQIRRMFEFLGYNVLSLKRVQHANLTLFGLKRGEFKPIKPQQIKELRNFLSNLAKKND